MTGVIYARYSCDKQTENSILGQVRDCSNFAKQNNIDIIKVYKDEAISGRTAERRPSFMQMIKESKSKLFDCVIVWKGDRFARNRADAAKYKTELKKVGVTVLSATEANCTGPEAILMDGINEAFAEYYSVELAAKVDRGMIQNAIDGRFNGGRLPIGYKKEDGKVVIDEERARFIRAIFKDYLSGAYSLKELYEKYTKLGFTNNLGQKVSRSSFYRIFEITKYYGYYEYKGNINKEIFPAIISEEEFNSVHDKMLKITHRPGKYKAKANYLLSNKLICGDCLSYFTGSSSKGKNGNYKHFYYSCRGRNKGCAMPYIDKDIIENAVIECICENIFSENAKKDYVKRLTEYSKISDPAIDQIKTQIKNNKQKLQNLITCIENGGDVVTLTPRMNELKDAIGSLQSELKKAEIRNNVFTDDQIETFIKSFRYKDYLKEENKKYLIDTLLECVYIYSGWKTDIFLKNGKRILFNITTESNKISNGSPT